MRRVAIYAGVSTGSQSTENQERELRAVSEKAGWEVVDVYRDSGISGIKGREARPAFDALCKDAARRKFNMVAAWSVDRLSRSLHDLTGFLEEIHDLKVDLYLHRIATILDHDVVSSTRVRKIGTAKVSHLCRS